MVAPQAGRKALVLRTITPLSAEEPAASGWRRPTGACGAASACANRLSCRFVSLYAGVSCEAHEHEVRERLCRYIARPAAAVKRLTVNAQGKVVYLLKTPYRDGTTHVVFEPRDFIGVETVDPINPYFRSWPI